MARENFHGDDLEAKSSPQRQGLAERLAAVVRSGDGRILDAFRTVRRELFVPSTQRQFAYDDRALPLYESQTISQPTMIAIMLDALRCEPSDRTLEVGAGCGYAAALLSCLVAEVYAIEILPSLAAVARENLAAAGIRNVDVFVGDGNRGLAKYAPFDRILVSAGAPRIPTALIDQLAVGGRIAVPVDAAFGQKLMVGEKRPSGIMTWTENVPCTFVPLVGGATSG